MDDSSQPFALWIPPGYSPKKAWPLVVALHGSDADHRMIPEECFRIHERGFDERVILLSPFGRGDVDWRWMGEADVWDAIAWVRKRYRIDLRRQYLTGLSLGGYAAWRMAAERPDYWAAIAPVCGGGDVATMPALKRMPVWCVHGAQDRIVPVERSREMMAALGAGQASSLSAKSEGGLSTEERPFTRLSATLSPSDGARAEVRGFLSDGKPAPQGKRRYDELADWGHDSWRWLYDPERGRDSLVGWFLKHSRAMAPRPVTKPKRSGLFNDLFSERLIIVPATDTPIPREAEQLRQEAERVARFQFGDLVMRSGQLRVKPDRELTEAEAKSANLLFIGRTDNHAWMRRIERRLLVRHMDGRLVFRGETMLGKSWAAATVQGNPWGRSRLLGVLTYQQRGQIAGLAGRFIGVEPAVGHTTLVDTKTGKMLRG